MSGRGRPATRIVFHTNGDHTVRSGAEQRPVGFCLPGSWHDLRLTLDVARHRFDLSFDGEVVLRNGFLMMPLRNVERLTLRTGPRRRGPTLDTDRRVGEDLPDADEVSQAAIFRVRTLRITFMHQNV
ncbi:MAG: hypothetical protein HC802_14255 [Caldilineaceae bacterium]|nr:hypothetical protein [Caldilineaceae bacterium]